MPAGPIISVAPDFAKSRPVRSARGDVLTALTSQSLGFVPGASADDRAAAVLRWRSWYEGAKDRVVFDRASRRFVVP